MSSYRVDITNPKIQNALKELGITPEELIVKDINEFFEPGISKKIQELRYEHHKQKLNSLSSSIQSYIKENHKERSRASSQTRSTISQYPNDVSTERISKQHKSSLAQKIEEESKRRKLLEIVNKKQNRRSLIEKQLKKEIEERKNKDEEKRKAHKERLKMIILEQIKKRKNISEKVTRNYSKTPEISIEENKSRMPSKIGSILEQKKERELEEEYQLLERLEFLNEKVEKSAELHEQMLKTKSERMSYHTQKIENKLHSISSTKEEMELNKAKSIVNNIIQKSLRRGKTIDDTNYRIKSTQDKLREKQLKIRHNLKEVTQQEKERIKNIENKLNISYESVRQKQASWLKDLEIKNELQKMKEEDVFESINRKKRIEEVKRSRILEKHSLIRQKLEALKEEKERYNEMKRHKALSEAIEKDHVRNLKSRIEKTKNLADASLLSSINCN
ncbi:unnamed protein product [Blepharisma stoltei]|uniref:Uncharacterized protein n=1 Tax=Blepharisma stoltei TaxID=1481888 RepID=A0AAU9JCY2_9CILI|nr:unnamed protein product [Blepharisma stoltei]